MNSDQVADRLEAEYEIRYAQEAIRQLRHLNDRHGVFLTRAEVKAIGSDGIAELYERHDHGDCQLQPSR